MESQKEAQDGPIERCAQAVAIYPVAVEPFRFEKHLVAGLLGKTHYLGLDARTIPRTGRTNLARIERRPIQI